MLNVPRLPRPIGALVNPTGVVKLGPVGAASENSFGVVVSLHASAPVATATTVIRTRCGRSHAENIILHPLGNRRRTACDPFASFGAVRAISLPAVLAEPTMTVTARLGSVHRRGGSVPFKTRVLPRWSVAQERRPGIGDLLCERSNVLFDECLNENYFTSLIDAKRTIEAWRK